VKRTCVMIGLLFLSATFAVGSGFGQDKQKETPGGKGTLPSGWGKLGLSADQKKKVYAIGATYGQKINDLKAQIEQLRKDEFAEQVKVLTPEQFDQLKKAGADKLDAAKDEKKDDKKKQ
jgi:Spy/CpxP family protein refolding chaperone